MNPSTKAQIEAASKWIYVEKTNQEWGVKNGTRGSKDHAERMAIFETIANALTAMSSIEAGVGKHGWDTDKITGGNSV